MLRRSNKRSRHMEWNCSGKEIEFDVEGAQGGKRLVHPQDIQTDYQRQRACRAPQRHAIVPPDHGPHSEGCATYGWFYPTSSVVPTLAEHLRHRIYKQAAAKSYPSRDSPLSEKGFMIRG